jgi:hypothetical protein
LGDFFHKHIWSPCFRQSNFRIRSNFFCLASRVIRLGDFSLKILKFTQVAQIFVLLFRVARFFLTQYTKTGENIPNCHLHNCRMAIKYSNLFHFEALQNLPNFSVWKYTIWQPCYYFQRLISTKNGLGHILGDFLPNPSGHPARKLSSHVVGST